MKMSEHPKGTNYLDLVRKYIPDADDNYASYVLWDKTPFPSVKDPETLEKYIMNFAEEIQK